MTKSNTALSLESSTPSLVEELWTKAKIANGYRRQQQFEQAIQDFDTVIQEAEPSSLTDILVYSYARRGAAKMAQGFYTNEAETSGQNGAIEDLKHATELNPNEGWAWAQLGEAHRLYAKARYRFPFAASDPMQNPDESIFSLHLEKAVMAFKQADALYPEEADWVQAHWGATYFLSVWRASQDSTAKLPEFHLEGETLEEPDLADPQACLMAALAKFQRAVELNPGYAWAKRFIGYILTMQKDYAGAIQKLGEAFLDDPTGQLFMLRSSSLLFLYAATQSSDEAEKKAFYLRALNASQRVLNYHNSEDYASTYVQARALHGLGYANATQICSEGRDRLLNTIARITGLALRLHEAAGHDVNDFGPLLDAYLGTFDRDDEIIMIRNHDQSIDDEMFAHCRKSMRNLIRKRA